MRGRWPAVQGAVHVHRTQCERRERTGNYKAKKSAMRNYYIFGFCDGIKGAEEIMKNGFKINKKRVCVVLRALRSIITIQM